MEQFLVASNIVLWVVVIVQALFLLALFRYTAMLLDRVPPQGPALGKHAPRREVVDIASKKHILGEQSERHHILIFTSRTCPWCKEMAPHIAPFAASLTPDFDLLMLLAEPLPPEDARTYAQELGGARPVKLAVAPELFETFGVPGTPYGVLIDKDGVVRTKGTTNTLTDLQTLVRVPENSGRGR